MLAHRRSAFIAIAIRMMERNVTMLAQDMSSAVFAMNCFDELVPNVRRLFGFKGPHETITGPLPSVTYFALGCTFN